MLVDRYKFIEAVGVVSQAMFSLEKLQDYEMQQRCLLDILASNVPDKEKLYDIRDLVERGVFNHIKYHGPNSVPYYVDKIELDQ